MARIATSSITITDVTDGVSYTGTTEYYKLTNNTTAPTVASGSWLTSPQSPTSSNQYLWNFNRNTRTIGSDIDSPVSLITQYVKDGRGISGITEKYQLGTSASTAPTGTWQTTLSGAGSISASNPYLWNQTTIAYSDSSTSTVIVTLIAAKGDDGDPGAVSTVPGPAGAGFFRYGINETSWPATATASGYLNSAADRTVVQDDVLTIFGSTTSHITETRRYDGSAWVAADFLIHGDMIVEGTIVSSRLATGAITADMVTTGTGYERIEISNTSIKVYNNNILRVKIGLL